MGKEEAAERGKRESGWGGGGSFLREQTPPECPDPSCSFNLLLVRTGKRSEAPSWGHRSRVRHLEGPRGRTRRQARLGI